MLLLLLLALITASEKPRERDCEILDYGIHDPDTPRTRYADPTSATGTRFESDEVEFIEHTKVIDMEVGRGFGIRYHVRNLPTKKPVRVTWRISFPKPGIRGHKAWEHTFDEQLPGGELDQHLLYDFDYDYELLAGRWTFDVLVDGKPKCSFAFQVQ